MALIIKCSGDCSVVGGYPRLAAFGFTVRHEHCIVYRESGVLCQEVAASAGAAKQESVRRAVAWLLTQPVAVDAVSIRCDGLEAASDQVLGKLRSHGWAVHLHSVSPEAVSEAVALSRCTVLAALRGHGLVDRVVWEKAAARAAGVRRTSLRPLKRVLRTRQDAGAAADLIIICDGGYKPRPYGIATYACLAWTGVKVAHRESGVACWGRAARSYVAELAAAVAALRWLAASPLADGARVQLRTDNQWVVDTMTGRCRRGPLPGTVMLLRTADRLMARLQRCGCEVAVWKVPRKWVAEADTLCRKAYRERLDRALAGNSRQSLKAFLRAASTE